MKVTSKWIKENYEKFNHLYFDDKLPNNIKFIVSRGVRVYGYASYRYDYPNNKVKPTSIKMTGYWEYSEKEQINVLLHEMIHILDYVENPHHFVWNHRRVHGKSYDAHGYWFLKQAARLNSLGFNITPKVTPKVSKASKMTARAKENMEKRKNTALIFAVVCGFCVWYGKTSKKNISELRNTIRRRYSWNKEGNLESINFYSFTNDKIASMRSCSKKVSGWKVSKEKFENIKKEYKMVEYC